jgi:hypothetical protein
MIQDTFQGSNVSFRNLCFCVLRFELSQTSPVREDWNYLEFEQLSGCGWLEILDVWIHKRAGAQVEQGSKVNPAESQAANLLRWAGGWYRDAHPGDRVAGIDDGFDKFPIFCRPNMTVRNKPV